MGRDKQGTDLKGLIWLAKEVGLYAEDKGDPKFEFSERFLQLHYGEWIGGGWALEIER